MSRIGETYEILSPLLLGLLCQVFLRLAYLLYRMIQQTLKISIIWIFVPKFHSIIESTILVIFGVKIQTFL